MFEIVDAKDDWEKVDTLKSLLSPETRMTDLDLKHILDLTGPLYWTDVAQVCAPHIGCIREGTFLELVNLVPGYQKLDFAAVCLPQVMSDTTLCCSLDSVRNTDKVKFANVCFQAVAQLRSETLREILSNIENFYKAGFISTWHAKINDLSDTSLSSILESTSDLYKTDVLEALRDKFLVTPATQRAIVSSSSNPYTRRELAKLLQSYVAKSKKRSQDTEQSQQRKTPKTRQKQRSATKEQEDSPAATSVSETKLRADEEKRCVVCLESPACGVFVPCGHKVCCMECGDKLEICPNCRGEKIMFIKVFEV